MFTLIKEVKTGQEHFAKIDRCPSGVFPRKEDGWQFDWRNLALTVGAMFYRLTLQATPDVLEGVIMLTLINKEMLYMNNLEVAPHNYGADGKFDRVAGSLIALTCLKSFELGRGAYTGYLSFDSKTELIELYQARYGATLAAGQKMFISPEAGKVLIMEYLNIKL